MGKKADPNSVFGRVRDFIKTDTDITFNEIEEKFPEIKKEYLYSIFYKVKKSKETRSQVKDEKELTDIVKNNEKKAIDDATPDDIVVDSSSISDDYLKIIRVVEEIEPEILERVIPERVIDVFKVCDTKIFKVGKKYIKTARCPGCRSVLASLDVTREVNAAINTHPPRRKD